MQLANPPAQRIDFRAKLLAESDLERWRASLPAHYRPLVVTNGCFDLLHRGHLQLLEEARGLGASLLVGVNDDATIRRLKGLHRPIVPEADRSAILAGLEAVTFVSVFRELNAVTFLQKVQPDVYVKGGDYNLETMNQEEKILLQAMGTVIQFASRVDGRSTTEIVQEIRRRENISASL